MKVNVDVPDEYQGDLIGDLNRRRGRIFEVDSRGGLSQILSLIHISEPTRPY